MIMIVIIMMMILLHDRSGDPFANSLPPIRTIPPGQVAHKGLQWASWSDLIRFDDNPYLSI